MIPGKTVKENGFFPIHEMPVKLAFMLTFPPT